MTSIVNFELAKNEWFMNMRIQGKEQAVFLGVHWEDNKKEALLKARNLLNVMCPLEVDEEEATPEGLMFEYIEDFRVCVADW